MSGPRRLSQKEARLGGAKGQRDHRYRHGDGKTAADLMPEGHLDESTTGFSRRCRQESLAPGDHRSAPGFVAHDRYRPGGRGGRGHGASRKCGEAIAEGVAGPRHSAPHFAIERNAVRAARQVAELATALGLSPIARSRIALSTPEPAFPDNPHLRVIEFIGPDGKRRRA